MKQIIFALLMALTCCSLAYGKNRTVTENDSLGNKKRVIEIRDTMIDGKATTDTLSVMTYENSASIDETDDSCNWKHHKSNRNWGISGLDFSDNVGPGEMIISIIAIVFVFGFPIAIVFLVFFFRYKNRKAKYRLVEQALASGQQLPENIFKEATQMTDTRVKGIKNAFLGLGLFIFLWAATESFGMGCIGLLVMFTGLGQIVIHYTQQSIDRKPLDHTDNEQK